eukprot:Em0033g2a
MGVVKHKYISSVYLNQLYQQVVTDVAEESMKAAVERVKESPHHAKSGERIVHFSTHRIVEFPLFPDSQHRVAQTRELVACTKIVLPQVLHEGLNITEVAHDYQSTIKLYVRQLGMVNSTTLGMVSVGIPTGLSRFNHQLLTYLPKRIHFHTKTFEMRMNLAVMDWNENCQRMATSHHEYTDVRRPDHHSTYNVLVKKTILQDDEDDDEMVLPDDAAMYDGDYVEDLEPWLQLALDGLV